MEVIEKTTPIERAELLTAAGHGLTERGIMLLRRVLFQLDVLEYAAREVLKWYDKDGSVGGACDPMEALRVRL